MKIMWNIVLWLISLFCAIWMYGFFCYIWNATLGGKLACFDPLVQYGAIGPFIGFPVSIICIIYGQIWNKVLSIPLVCFHGFWVLFLLLGIIKGFITQ